MLPFSLSMSSSSKGTTSVRPPAPSSVFVHSVTFFPLTPLPLSLYNLQSLSTTDIKIDIETVEKLIGEIIVQPLR
jgi:hypothetical protein